jgi:hypothetical protein
MTCATLYCIKDICINSTGELHAFFVAPTSWTCIYLFLKSLYVLQYYTSSCLAMVYLKMEGFVKLLLVSHRPGLFQKVEYFRKKKAIYRVQRSLSMTLLVLLTSTGHHVQRGIL